MTAAARARPRTTRSGILLGPKARTESMTRLPKRELEAGRVHLRLVEDLDAARPRSRGDCAGVARPCTWVGCRFNLFLDVNEDTGSIKYNFPDREPGDMPPDFSCALDVADAGGATLEDLGRLANVSRERIRQIETKALARVKARGKKLRDFSDAPEDAPIPSMTGVASIHEAREERVPLDEDEDDDPPAARISFFAEKERLDAFAADVATWDSVEPTTDADRAVCSSVWNIYAKDSNARGFFVDANAVGHRRRASRKFATPREETMQNESLTPKEENVLAAYRAFESKNGRPPSRIELGHAAGFKAKDKHSMQSCVYGATKRLVARGLIPAGRPGGTQAKPAPVPAPGAVKRRQPYERKPRTALVDLKARSVTPAVTNDPVLAGLIARRDVMAEKVAALTCAIEALSS